MTKSYRNIGEYEVEMLRLKKEKDNKNIGEEFGFNIIGHKKKT